MFSPKHGVYRSDVSARVVFEGSIVARGIFEQESELEIRHEMPFRETDVFGVAKICATTKYERPKGDSRAWTAKDCKAYGEAFEGARKTLSALTLVDTFADQERVLIGPGNEMYRPSLDLFFHSLSDSPFFNVREKLFVRVRNDSDTTKSFQLMFICFGQLKKAVK